MSFFNEILNSENIKELDFDFKIIILDTNLILLNGFSKIISLSKDSIVVKMNKNKRVNIKGENFVITTLSKDELVARGTLGGVEFD